MKLLKTIGIAALIAGMSALSAFAHSYKVGTLEIRHPHSPATLPGAPVGAGFLTITNTGTDDDRLTSVSTPIAGEGQIHEMAMEGEVMKMRQLKDGIAIPAGATVELKRGGLHLMFMQLKEPMKEGGMVKATLTFEKAGTVDVEFKVEAANAKHEDHMNHAASADMAQPEDAKRAIPMVMKALFETPDNPLYVDPVVVDGAWAVASWAQGEKGGRALLKKGEKGWSIHLCSGASLKDAAALKQIGLEDASATKIAADLATAEAALGEKQIALFDSFEGTMMIGADGGHGAGHGADGGHDA
ncbi:MAG: hypothetical protein RIR97_1594, partial [Pseudomonadota bacterium]